MNVLSHWWQSRFGKATPAPVSDRLAQARALAREGRAAEASELFFKLGRKHEAADWLVEHAELLLQLGNHYGAASQAARALQLEPKNARALLVQRKVRDYEDAPRTAIDKP